jgi:hypothetical protein
MIQMLPGKREGMVSGDVCVYETGVKLRNCGFVLGTCTIPKFSK